VRKGAQLDLDTNRIGNTSSATFTLESGATAISAHAAGLRGNITSSVVTAMSKSAHYTYDGIIAQIDSLMPDTVKNFSINNPSGFALVRSTVVTGILSLQLGQLDNSVFPVIIAPGGSVVKTGGSTKVNIPGWTSVLPLSGNVPGQFALHQNYPNPFNPSTTVEYFLPNSGYTTLKIMDVLGREVATLVKEVQESGRHTAVWNAGEYPSGLYFFRLESDQHSITKKMQLVK
jgi:hypothetical protein